MRYLQFIITQLSQYAACMSTVEASELSASVEAEWMRDQEESPKILISRRRGGLFKHQNNSFLILNGTTSSAALRAAATPPQPRRRVARLIADERTPKILNPDDANTALLTKRQTISIGGSALLLDFPASAI